MRRTSGKSTGEFMACFRGVGRTEPGRKDEEGRSARVRREKRGEDGEMFKKQEPGRDVKRRNGERRLRKEERGKEQRGR